MKRILLDQNVPHRLVQALASDRVETAFERGWSVLGNGDLIAAAEAYGFEIPITADQTLEYQQNLVDRRIAILVLDTNRRPVIQRCLPAISAAVEVVAAIFRTSPAFGPEPHVSPGNRLASHSGMFRTAAP